MAVTSSDKFAAVLQHFRIDGTIVSAEPHGSGHINRSYRVTYSAAGTLQRYLLQQLNTAIFTHYELLMENIQRVTSHLKEKLKDQPDAERRVLTPVHVHNGQTWHRDEEGDVWRVFRFIENARTFDAIESPVQAFEAARAFGRFQQQLADLPLPRLHETIPAFHDTPQRFRHMQDAVSGDSVNRAAVAKPEISFASSHEDLAGVLVNAALPERVTHNDTKLNNVMFDSNTGEALCVVDLDTVMPGLALYDFGDMVRTATSPSAEDEQDLSRVSVQLPLFEALARGYLSTAREFLTQAEIEHLPVCGKVIAFEQGVRFLDDYLRGDVYYKVAYPDQNLHRCRTQFKLVESIEQQQRAMELFVRTL